MLCDRNYASSKRNSMLPRDVAAGIFFRVTSEEEFQQSLDGSAGLICSFNSCFS
jgi:hypothetical protein